MEDEEKIEEEINQEKTNIKYQCPGVPKINMDAPMDKSYEMVLLNLGICSIIPDEFFMDRRVQIDFLTY